MENFGFESIIIPTQNNGAGLKFVDLLNSEVKTKRKPSYDLRYSMNTTTNKAGETVIKRSFLLKKALLEGQDVNTGWTTFVGSKNGESNVYLVQVKEGNSLKLPILFCKGESCSNKIISEALFGNLESVGALKKDIVEKDFTLSALETSHPEILKGFKIVFSSEVELIENQEEVVEVVE